MLMNNAIKRILLATMIILGISLTNSTGQIASTFYIKPMMYNFQVGDFGLPTDYNGTDNTLESFGLQFISLGQQFFFDDGNSNWRIKPGIDISFFDLNYFRREVFEVDPISGIGQSNYYDALFFESKIGPVVVINPIDKLLIDVYAQVAYSIGGIDYINNVSYNTSSVRFVGGISFGYSIISINSEFNYGVSPINVETTPGEYEEIELNSSYIKLGICLKFSAFKKYD
jgi:hypothetical protein